MSYQELLDNLAANHVAAINELRRSFAAEMTVKDAEIDRLLKALEAATPKPKVREPRLDKEVMRDILQVTVTLGLKSPSRTIDVAAGKVITLVSKVGANSVRFFRGSSEVLADLGRSETDERNLPALCKRLGLILAFDTLDSVEKNTPDDEKLKDTVLGMETLGGSALWVNDANQYRNKDPKWGVVYEDGYLERMVERIRSTGTVLPLVASVGSSHPMSEYKTQFTNSSGELMQLFDYVEAQTFGKPSELEPQLKRPYDMYTLDGQRSVSPDYLNMAMKFATAKSNIAVYTALDGSTDWRTAPEVVDFYTRFATAWKKPA